MLSCHCLNIIIETEGDLEQVTSETLTLSPEECHDIFFKDVALVSKLVNINKSHSSLVHTRNVGAWIVHCCINCDIHSHAVHRDKGASCILVSSKLYTKEKIDKLQASESFSQLYKIIINIEGNVDDELPSNYLPSDVENVIRGLKQVAADGLKNESVKVEERIRQFSDEQYSKLNELREKTFKEQQILSKIILTNVNPDKLPASCNTNTPVMSNPQGIPSRINEPLAAGSVQILSSPKNHPLRHTPKRQKSCPHPTPSFDSEGLFELEGTDDALSGGGSGPEIDDSDAEESTQRDKVPATTAVKIPKRITGSQDDLLAAKSLPMTIPAFLSASARQLDFEDLEDIAPPVERNADIAASIKALAKSVHGDAVFGDLPKPRYTYF